MITFKFLFHYFFTFMDYFYYTNKKFDSFETFIAFSMITQEILHFILQKHENDNQDLHSDFANIKTIDRVENISYIEFFKNYMILNKPCIISHNATKKWKSSLEWVSNHKPNFNFLKINFGSSIVPVANCNVQEYNAQKKQNMLLRDYLDYWCSKEKDKNEELLYLKDWHFKRQFPKYSAYKTPEYFQSDWLNEFCENQDDDYQFIYMGPKGTWTPLHADVFGSYSWSINICGCKRWLLFPPGHENCLKNKMKQLPYIIESTSLDEKNIFYIEVIQRAQEIIFVPSGWYHQVWNMEDTISINHNWFNACNIDYIWKCIQLAKIDVENEIADCKGYEGWTDQLHIILKAHHGMNYSDFLQMLENISSSRISNFYSDPENINWHSIFDLFSIKHLYLKMKSEISENMLIQFKKSISIIDKILLDIKI